MDKVKVIFRVDSDPDTGLGHITRSIAVADELRQKYKADITFMSSPHPFLERKLRTENYNCVLNTKGLVEEEFISAIARSHKYDVMVIDRQYAYSSECIRSIKTAVRVCLLENFCEGSFNADCVIFPSAHLSDEIRDNRRWGTGMTDFFSGPEFVIINDDIKKIRNRRKNQNQKKGNKHVVITTGGSDSKKVALKLLEWMLRDRELTGSAKVTFLSGKLFAYRKEMENILHGSSNNIELKDFDRAAFLDADLAICTFGVTAYELIYLGVPVLAIGRSRQTARGARILAERYDVIRSLGFIDTLSKNRFKGAVGLLLNDLKKRREISNRQLSFLDGKGAERVAGKIMALKRRV